MLVTPIFCALHAFVAIGPLQMPTVHGLFGLPIVLAFLPFGVGDITGTIIGGRHADHRGLRITVLIATPVSLLVHLLFAVGLDTEGRAPLILLSALLLIVGSTHGRPAMMAAAIARVGQPGTVAGLLTSTALLGATVVAPLATWGLDRVSTPLTSVPLLLFLIGGGLGALTSRRHIDPPAAPAAIPVGIPVAADEAA